LRTDRYDKAIENFDKGLNITEKTRSSRHPYAVEARTNLAKAYREKGKFASALMHLKQAENSLLRSTETEDEAAKTQLNTEFRHPVYAIDVLDEKGKTLHLQYKASQPNRIGLLKSALSTYTRLSDLLDVMQVGFQSEESKLIMRSRSHRIYESAIQVSFDLYKATENRSYLNDIFFFSEKSKSRVILELLNNKRAKKYAGVPDSLLAYERNLREKLAEIQQALHSDLSITGSEPDNDSLESSLFNLHRNLNKHLQKLEEEYPKYHSFRFKSQVPNLVQLKKQLYHKDVTLLEYFLGEKSTWAILVNENDINVLPLPHIPKVTGKISRFNRAISQKNDSVYISLAHQFYKNLIEPIKDFIPTNEVLIVPDGALNLMPFEALLTAPVNNVSSYTDYPFLLKNYVISYMPSVSLSTFFDEQQENAYSDKFVGYAPVFSGSKMSNLPEIASRNNWDALPSTRYE
ncbi:MAG: tetratricopeptide repeat protein, partial [Candidatus Halalkalibacterium sp. M3_1C_030]